jgi:hypothetical protein
MSRRRRAMGREALLSSLGEPYPAQRLLITPAQLTPSSPTR